MNIQTINTGTKPTVYVRPRKHHLWEIDCSGSMYWAMDALAKDVTARIHLLPNGDLISIGTFSSAGDWRWHIVGWILSDETRKEIKNMVKQIFSARAMTCFSDILADTSKVITNTSSLSANYSLVFFTDGHPNSYSPQVEREKILTAIREVRGQLSDSLIIGYGNYYNRELLSKMALELGSAFIHANDINDFGDAVVKFSDSGASKRKAVKVPEGTKLAFIINQDGTVSNLSNDNGEVLAPENTPVYVATNGKQEKETTNVEVVYAAALVQIQSEDLAGALETLGTIGDVAIIDALNSAITNDEIGRVEALLRKAISSKAGRFVNGQRENYVPKADATDLLDVLELLAEDNDAAFYPMNPEFKYNRIGARYINDESYPKFEADKGTGISFGNLVWHKDRLNLSVLAQIPGKVTLKGEPAKYGFASEYPCFRYATYNLVFNGFPNVTILPASMSEKSFILLRGIGVIDGASTWHPGSIYRLDLTKVPVCNRAKASGGISASRTAKMAAQALELEGIIKAYNSLLTELDPNKTIGKVTAFTPEQEAFLLSNGIKDGKYDPPSTKAETTDVLKMREFSIKIKGFSSLPSLNEVRKQREKNKYTPGGLLVAEGLMQFETVSSNMSTEAKVLWLKSALAGPTKSRKQTLKQIQFNKFAMIMGKQWFTDLKRTEDTVTVSIDTNSYTVTFELKEDVEEKI